MPDLMFGQSAKFLQCTPSSYQTLVEIILTPTTYFTFIEKMTTLASSITKEIRNASLKKNAELSTALEVTEKVSEMATDARNEGLSAHHKSFLKSKLTNAQNSVRQAPLKDEVDVYYQEIAFEELDMLIGTVKGSTSFKALNSMKGLSSIEKKHWKSFPDNN